MDLSRAIKPVFPSVHPIFGDSNDQSTGIFTIREVNIKRQRRHTATTAANPYLMVHILGSLSIDSNSFQGIGRSAKNGVRDNRWVEGVTVSIVFGRLCIPAVDASGNRRSDTTDATAEPV